MDYDEQEFDDEDYDVEENEDNDDYDDEGVSEVLSTASEFGTVINVGGTAARLAEIDAMAALIEADPAFDERSNEDVEVEDTLDYGLALPVLETKSFDRPASLSTQNKKVQMIKQSTSFVSSSKDMDIEMKNERSKPAAPQKGNNNNPINPTTSGMVTAAI